MTGEMFRRASERFDREREEELAMAAKLREILRQQAELQQRRGIAPVKLGMARDWRELVKMLLPVIAVAAAAGVIFGLMFLH